MSNVMTPIATPMWNLPSESVSQSGFLSDETPGDCFLSPKRPYSDEFSSISTADIMPLRSVCISCDSSIAQEVERVFCHLFIQKVLVPGPDKVQQYLFGHPDLMGIVTAMASALREQFPSPTQISLDHYTSMEEDDQHLVIHVRQAPYQNDILECIDQAVRRFDERLASASGWIHPTTDFAPPKE